MIKLYNTLTSTIEPFQSIDASEVKIYSCGPTVYQFVHIGNLRTFVLSDLLRRVLEWNGFAVRQAMNITDVGHLTSDADEGEDKLEKAAKLEHKNAWELAEFYTKAFLVDIKKVNILTPHILPRATDHIDEQINLIRQLEVGNYVYKIDDGIYFDISKLKDYPQLSSQEISQRQAGARVEENSQKRNPADFALWKFSYPGGRKFDVKIDGSAQRRQMEWSSPWGLGFPGWHLECSAMSTKYLGQPFDIHTGAIDLIDIHHANEIAQSEAAYEKPLANYWLHGQFVKVDNQKMAKSLGNIYKLSDLIERGYDPLAFRLLILMTHYRKPLNFTWAALKSAAEALDHLRLIAKLLPKASKQSIPEDLEDSFRSTINNDLNLPQALASFWEVLKYDKVDDSVKAAVIKNWDTVFGLKLIEHLGQGFDIPQKVKQLAGKRQRAREEGEFDLADELRHQIEDEGFSVRDTKTGSEIVPKSKPTIL